MGNSQRPGNDRSGSSSRGGNGGRSGGSGGSSRGGAPRGRSGGSDDSRGYRGNKDGGKPYGGKPSGERSSGGKSYGKPSGERSGSGKPYGERSSGSKPYGERSGSGRSGGEGSSSGRPYVGKSSSGSRSDGGKFGGRSNDRRDGDQRRGGGDRPGRKNDWSRPRDEQLPRSESQARYDGPPIPEEITGRELDHQVLAQLKALPEKLAQRVARHLVAAGLVIDSDPKTAYEHTLAARARAARLAVVREACGEAAYAAGEYAEALSELRAAKRMNGATAYLPIMADCERALGRPERALELAKLPSVANFSSEAKAEMTIVEAGARQDMGQFDAALRTLEAAPLNSKSRSSWVVRLRYAYADALLAAGRPADALEWFHRTEAIDGDEITDAGARASRIEVELG
ncbi:tetratricopeptide repeat protein [Nocardioides sp. Bht2]|uniref:tetratricopeptide repeat protein n=1 Tax=Nocardioides sp. Bht2 TaxID=3392297 RepID=UPI0039B3C729